MNYTDDSALPPVTDETLRGALTQTQPFTIVILKAGPRFSPPGPDREPSVAAIIWEHGKRNFALRQAGFLRVVCPVADGTDVTGVGIFDASPQDTDRIMSGDPAVQAGVLDFEIHPTRSFPGSTLASG